MSLPRKLSQDQKALLFLDPLKLIFLNESELEALIDLLIEYKNLSNPSIRVIESHYNSLMFSPETVQFLDMLRNLATVAVFFVIAYEMRKASQIESRSQILETRKMFQDLYEYRKLAVIMEWKDYDDFKQKYPITSDSYWASQVILDFFDMIGDSVRHKELAKRPMIRLWGTQATWYWGKFKEVIKARNEELNISSFDDLEWLSEETMKLFPSLRPEVPFQGNIPLEKK